MTEPIETAIDRFYTDVGRRIRDARVRTGATQAAVAARASMTRSSLANVEAGRQRIPVHVLVLVAEVLEVEPAELFSAQLYASRSLSFSDVLDELGDASEREFVEGAIAQLGTQLDEKEEK